MSRHTPPTPRLSRKGQIFFGIDIILVLVIFVATFALVKHTTSTHPTLPALPCSPTTAGTSQAVVHMDGDTTVAATAIGTTFQFADEVAPASTKQQIAQTLLTQWHPAMVRLHFAFRADNVGSLPEGTQGVWNFGPLDAAVAQLRSDNQPFYLNVRTAPAWMFDAQGQLRDPTFHEFATYMARLVGWYNKGGFTDDTGVFHASGHQGWIPTWEVWNEPNSGYEIPVPPADQSATWMQPANFARLYNVTSAAMRAVDPTIHTGGPTVSSYPDNPYIATFVQNVTQPLDFLTFHFYAVGNQLDSDSFMFSQIAGQRLLDRITAIKLILATEKPESTIPIWVDELGFDEVSRLPVDPRGTSQIAYAYLPAVLTMLEKNGIAYFGQFPLLGNDQQGLMNYQDYHTYPIYWLYVELTHQFPPGMLIVPSQIPRTTAITTLAMLTPDKHSVRVLLGNTRLQSPTDNNGTGVDQKVCLSLVGLPITPQTPAQVWSYDANTPKSGPPAPLSVSTTTQQKGYQTDMTLDLGGYSGTIIDIPLQ